MNNPLKSDGSTSLALLLARVPVGVTLAIAGAMKFRAPGGVTAFVNDNLSRVPTYMPDGFGRFYLQAIPFAELVLGVFLIAGFLTRLSGFLSALMLISFGLAFGLHGFVDTDPELASKVIQSPAVYATFALITFLAGPGRLSVDQLLFGGKSSGSRDRY